MGGSYAAARRPCMCPTPAGPSAGSNTRALAFQGEWSPVFPGGCEVRARTPSTGRGGVTGKPVCRPTRVHTLSGPADTQICVNLFGTAAFSVGVDVYAAVVTALDAVE